MSLVIWTSYHELTGYTFVDSSHLWTTVLVLCITITLQQVSRAVFKEMSAHCLFTMLHFVVLENLWLPLIVVVGRLQPLFAV